MSVIPSAIQNLVSGNQNRNGVINEAG
jgi:hypothetical protein